MVNNYQTLRASGGILESDISSMLQVKVLKWVLIGIESFAFIFFTYFGWEKLDKNSIEEVKIAIIIQIRVIRSPIKR